MSPATQAAFMIIAIMLGFLLFLIGIYIVKMREQDELQLSNYLWLPAIISGTGLLLLLWAFLWAIAHLN